MSKNYRAVKKFETFKGKGCVNFREEMIKYWCFDENVTKSEAMGYYDSPRFQGLCKRVESECEFIPDLGYTDKNIDGSLCFEAVDNDYPIPVCLLIISGE